MSGQAEEIAAIFGRGAPDYDQVIPFFVSFGRRLVEEAQLAPGEQVLDVGCGRGATLFPAAEAVGPNGRVAGVDLSEEMVALTAADVAQRGLTHVSVRRLDAGQLDLEPDSFDVVVASFLLHLVPDPAATATEIFRVLRPGGRCAASVPSGAGALWDFLFPLLQRYGPRATRPPAMPFRADFDLAATLTAAGFQMVRKREEEIQFSFHDEDEWWRWAWSHGMRGFFEVLAPSDLAELKAELLTEVAARRTTNGIPMPQRAQFVVAEVRARR